MRRLYWVVEGTAGLAASTVQEWAAGLMGPASSRIPLDDERLGAARDGRTVSFLVRLPHGEIAGLLANHLLPTARDPVLMRVRLGPWLRISGITMIATDDGNVEVPVIEHIGTLVDVMFEDTDVDVPALEAELAASLPPRTVMRSDGTPVIAREAGFGLLLVTQAEIRDPAVVWPEWSAPAYLTDPRPI